MPAIFSVLFAASTGGQAELEWFDSVCSTAGDRCHREVADLRGGGCGAEQHCGGAITSGQAFPAVMVSGL